MEPTKQVISSAILFSVFLNMFSDRIPEISDELYRIDDAMRAGFGWELGPFEVWDAIGLQKSLEGMKQYGNEASAWFMR
jgi:3-hydroxyacyl-CoA dehydrogenase